MHASTTTEHRHSGSSAHPLRARAITLAVLVAAMTTLLLAIPGLRDVLGDVRTASPGWLAIALALELGSCASFAVLFRHFFGELPARRARQFAWTEMGSGALLPTGGAGALAIGGWLMHRDGLATERIVKRSAGLFFLTSAVNVTAMVGAGLLLAIGLSRGPAEPIAWIAPVAAGVAVTAVALAIAAAGGRARRMRRPVRAIADGIAEALRVLSVPRWRLAGAIGYLGFDIAVLAVTLRAVGYSPPISVLVLSYIIGYLANIVPIPGAVGVLEGGLAGMLVLYGAPPAEAAAGVLLYHAVAFWIPSIGGLLAYRSLKGGAPRAAEARPQERAPAGRARPWERRARRAGRSRPATGGSAVASVHVLRIPTE